MKRFLRRAVLPLGVLALALGVLLLIGLREVPVPERARFAIDLGALRALAGPDDALPERARADLVGQSFFPEFIGIAGGGAARMPLGFYVWQFAYGDGSHVVIDAVHSRASHPAVTGAYYDDAWQRQERAVGAASVMAVTHEHNDHLGGFTESTHFDRLGAKLKLNAAQRGHPRAGGVARDLKGEATLESGPEGSLHKVAPGVVAISAPGHTPGTQMLYVRLKGGREFLLIGDIAWQGTALERVRNRPKLPTWILGEDSLAVAHQLRAILDFKKVNPSVDVVVSHDIGQMEARFAAGRVTRGLE